MRLRRSFGRACFRLSAAACCQLAARPRGLLIPLEPLASSSTHITRCETAGMLSGSAFSSISRPGGFAKCLYA